MSPLSLPLIPSPSLLLRQSFVDEDLEFSCIFTQRTSPLISLILLYIQVPRFSIIVQLFGEQRRLTTTTCHLLKERHPTVDSIERMALPTARIQTSAVEDLNLMKRNRK